VRADRTDTIGEFDFLLNEGDHLVHIEFATKFYLLDANSTSADFNGLIGPNLADSLGAKMRKIFDSSLRWPAIRPRKHCCRCRCPRAGAGQRLAVLPERRHADAGITQQHCHGFWMTQAQAQDCRSSVTPSCRAALAGAVENAGQHGKPQLLAALQTPPRQSWSRRCKKREWLVEERRGFVVPTAGARKPRSAARKACCLSAWLRRSARRSRTRAGWPCACA
jgi:hypothetical protein